MAFSKVLVTAALVALAQDPIAHNPLDGESWRRVAVEQQTRGDITAALASMNEAIALGALSRADGLVEIAALHAAAGDADRAAAELLEAVSAGYRFRASLARDRRFAALTPQQLARVAGTERRAEPGTLDAWRADLGYLVGEIRRLHPRFANGDPSAFTDALRDLERDLPGMRDQQIVIGMQRLLATAGDGHTLLYPFGMSHGALSRVPVGLYWFEDGMYIVNARDQTLQGSAVVAIDGEPIDRVLARLRPVLSLENEMQFRWAAPLYLTFPDFVARGPIDTPRSVWTLESNGGRRDVELTHEPINPAELETKLAAPPVVAAPRFLARRDEPAWFEVLSPGVLYVQVNAIANGEQESLAAFAARLSAELRSNGRGAAIVDLRNNSGGDASLADALLKTLMSFEEGGGRLIVLAGRTTFSAAQTLAARLEAWTDATFIGEPTGSRVNRYGNEAPFRLPHSGVRGTISSGWNQPVTSRDHRVWIAPDIPVVLTAPAYFSGGDPVLDRALAELRRPR